MPKGFKNLREELARIEERKAKALEEGGGDKDWTPVLWFKLPESAAGKTKDEVTSAMTAVIRPLEAGDDLTYALVHPVIIDGYPYPVDIVCRDQDNSGEACPGCEAGIKRAVKGFLNVIWRDAPDFPLDEESNKYNTKVDYESLPKSDKIAILSSGPTLFGRLDELDEDFTLTDHDFSITREGLKLNTKYKVKKIKKVALSAADKKLAEDKNDLSHYVRVPEYDEWIERSKGNFSRSSDDDEEAPSAPKNPLSAGRPENIFA
jgi:hypothetical protein